MIDREEVKTDQEFEQKVRTALQTQDPDQLFIDRLQKKLIERFRTIERSTDNKNNLPKGKQLLDRFKLVISPLAWGTIAIILILSLIWGIKNLLPGVEPGKNIQTSPSPMVSPKPLIVPTQAGGADITINLPTLAGMPVPWPEEAITAKNASQITELARWGRGTISAVTWASDGNSFALASGTIIHFYDSVNFQEINSIENGSAVYYMAYSPDGTKLASGAYESSVKIWDVASGTMLQTVQGSQNFSSLAFSPEGVILGTATYDLEGPIELWNADSGQRVRTLCGSAGYSFTFSPDWSILATVNGRRTIKLWDVTSGTELRTLDGHTEDISGMTFSRDGSRLASWSGDMTIKIWDVDTGNEQSALNVGNYINNVTLLPDGNTLISNADGQPITLWDIDSGEVLRTLGDSTQYGNILLSPDGKSVLYYGWQGDPIKLLDIASGEELRKLDWQAYTVTGGAVSPDGSIVAVGLDSGSIKLLDIANGQELRTLTGHTGGPSSLAFSPDGTKLASGASEMTKLWDVNSGEELISMEGVSVGWVGGAPSVDFSPDGKLLAFAGLSGQVKVWDVTNQVELLTLGGQGGDPSADEVMAVAFSPDGKILASGYAGGSIMMWDALNGQELLTLTKQSYSNNAWNRAIAGLEFSPNGKMLISGNWDKTITWWDATSGAELKTISLSLSEYITYLSVSPTGDVLAAGSETGSGVLLNVASNESLITLPSSANVLAFTPDGKVMVSGSYDGFIRLWGVAPPYVTVSEARTAPAEVEVISIATPAPLAAPVDLGIGKIPIPILLTGENLQLISFSPDNSYLLYSQQGQVGEPSPDQAYVTLNFLDNVTGETCEGIKETVTFTQTEWGSYPEGIALYERTAWIDDNRLLYINPSGELGTVNPCGDSVDYLSDLIPDRLLSLLGSSNADVWQNLIKGEQAFWLFTPANGQAVKLNIPMPPEGQELSIQWSPWKEELLSSWIDDRQGELWIVLERIDPATGAATSIYEVKASQDLYNVEPKRAYFDWVREDKICLYDVGTGMGLLDLSSQPPIFTDLFSGIFGIEGISMWDLAGYGTMPHTDVQEYIHLIIDTGMATDGQLYLYHPESGLVDKYPLNPPFLMVYPGGDGGIVQSFMEPTPQNDIYKVIFVDSDQESYDLVVKGHSPRQGSSLSANVLPGGKQALFSSSQGISLVELKNGETTNFWVYENQEQYQDYFPWVSADGKTVIVTANIKEPGQGAQTQAMYWLRLEP